MNKSHGESSTKTKRTKKVVLKERIGLITSEDPSITAMRRRGWYVSTRCTVHVCNSRDMFVDYQSLTNHEVILEDSNDHVEVAGIGTVLLRFTTGNSLTLSNVFHMPTIIKCIVSFGQLDDIGYSLCFRSGECTIEKNEEIVGKGFNEDGLFRLSIIEERPGRIPTQKVVLKETIALLTSEDPTLIDMRRHCWYLSNRCTVHVCNSRDMFVDYQPLSNHEVIVEYSNTPVEVAGIGKVVLRFTTGKVLTLSNVFHMPTIIKCIVSLGRLAGCNLTFESGRIVIKDANTHEIIGEGYNEDGLFRLRVVE